MVLVLAFLSLSLLFATHSFRLVFPGHLDGHLGQRDGVDSLEIRDADECEKEVARVAW